MRIPSLLQVGDTLLLQVTLSWRVALDHVFCGTRRDGRGLSVEFHHRGKIAVFERRSSERFDNTKDTKRTKGLKEEFPDPVVDLIHCQLFPFTHS